jgi:ATP-dependent protease ClpP protease subunit
MLEQRQDLPVYQHRKEILEAIEQNAVTIIAGEACSFSVSILIVGIIRLLLSSFVIIHAIRQAKRACCIAHV